jgi:hypothetical protein
MTEITVHDKMETLDRIYLEKLMLASDVLLEVGEDPDMLPNSFETDLHLFRERIQRALLMLKP